MTMLAGTLQMLPTSVDHSRIALEPHLAPPTRLEDAGVAAILVLGSTREKPSLADAELRRTLEATVDLAGWRIPALPGVLTVSLRSAVAWTCGVASPRP